MRQEAAHFKEKRLRRVRQGYASILIPRSEPGAAPPPICEFFVKQIRRKGYCVLVKPRTIPQVTVFYPTAPQCQCDQLVQEAIAIMIVYRPETGSIYLDTLAVCRQGHGIGSALLRFLIRRCEASAGRNGTREIRLDTEGCTESLLRAYYQRFGFGVASEDRTRGNITMVRKVGQTA